jgi:hypothetical protein
MHGKKLYLLVSYVDDSLCCVVDAHREIVILGCTVLVRQQLAPLDLEELQRARYELKGA